ncbi:MAG: Flp family type IVb pilin [Pseudomonadota bacterium]
MMTSFETAIRRLARDTRGATAIEYALIAGIIALGIILVITAVGTNLSALFGQIATEFQNILG